VGLGKKGESTEFNSSENINVTVKKEKKKSSARTFASSFSIIIYVGEKKHLKRSSN
jgi:hypothetical protein